MRTRRAARPETRQRPRPTTKPYHHKSTTKSGRRAPHAARVPFLQRRHTFAGLDVPHLEPVSRPRHDAPPVRKHGNAIDLQRRHIITKSTKKRTPQRTPSECPSSVATHFHSPFLTSHTLSVLSRDADTTRRPSGEIATLSTYDEARSSQKYSGRRNALLPSALPASPRIYRSPRPTP